ncbi:MAG TPA: SRPBCC family protein [Segeticoccus sp.]|jgi:hypothetical protein|nr:SRPBCC family protein [Segeticoccus sp.]
METPRHTDSVLVGASPEALYDLVSDVTRTGEWSPICRECWWRDEKRGVGAWFHGRNEADGASWQTESKVITAERGREFAWLVGGRFVRWGYTLEPEAQGTRLTESWEFRPTGIEMFHDKYGDAAPERIELRTRQARAGIPAALTAIKRIAEAEARTSS